MSSGRHRRPVAPENRHSKEGAPVLWWDLKRPSANAGSTAHSRVVCPNDQPRRKIPALQGAARRADHLRAAEPVGHRDDAHPRRALLSRARDDERRARDLAGPASTGWAWLSRDEALAHAPTIVDATDLPVSADLENGFGDAPDVVRRDDSPGGRPAGVVGGSIEDATGEAAAPRSTTRSTRSSAFMPRSRLRGRCRFRSCSSRGPRTSCDGRTDLDDTIAQPARVCRRRRRRALRAWAARPRRGARRLRGAVLKAR